MTAKGKSRARTIAIAIVLFALAQLAHLALWYFIMGNASSIVRAVTEVAQIGRPSGAGFQERIRIVDELSVVVMRYGIIPVFIGGIGDLVPYYYGVAIVSAVLIAIWAKRRW